MNKPILEVRFFKTDGGTEPVRDWLRELSATDRKRIGEDIKTVQFGWPLGMPLVRKMEKNLWEIRVHLDGRIARLLFTYCHKQQDCSVARVYQEISSYTTTRLEIGKRQNEE